MNTLVIILVVLGVATALFLFTLGWLVNDGDNE